MTQNYFTTHKICAAVNKRVSHGDTPRVRLWSAVCGFFLTTRVSAQRCNSGRVKGIFRGGGEGAG